MQSGIRKIVLGLLVFIIALSVFPTGLWHFSEALTQGDYDYSVTGGQATIDIYNGTAENVVVPSMLGGCSVTGISDPGFSWSFTLRTVVIPDSVKTIGDWSFCNCPQLYSVTIGTGITYIGYEAFKDCPLLYAVCFFGAPPASIGDDAAGNATLYYLEAYREQWSPHGETAWNGYPIAVWTGAVPEPEDDLPADGKRISGDIEGTKLTKVEIKKLLSDYPATLPSNIFSITPKTSAPYAAGSLSDEAIAITQNRMNVMRRLAGVPNVVATAELNNLSQHGAVLLAGGKVFSHKPPKPADMDEAFYQLAYEGTNSGNIAGGYTLTGAIEGFMEDSDASNIEKVGHRLWMLDEKLGKTGFGYAGRYMVLNVISDNNEGVGCDYDFISWPASGSFPNELFSKDTAWSVTLNSTRYLPPTASDLTVTLRSAASGKTWTFNGGTSYTPSSSGLYFNLRTDWSRKSTIIFRPDGISAYDGVYTVIVEGLKSCYGRTVSFEFDVDFFKASSYVPEVTPTPTPTPTSTPEPFVTITFMADGEEVAAYTIKNGTGLSTIPDVPYKQGCIGLWDSNVRGSFSSDAVVTAVYQRAEVDNTLGIISNIPPNTTISMLEAALNAKISSDGEEIIATGDLLIIEGKRFIAAVAGDVDGNGEVTAADASKILRAIVKLETLNELQAIAANTLQAGTFSAADASKILRWIVRLEPTIGRIL